MSHAKDAGHDRRLLNWQDDPALQLTTGHAYDIYYINKGAFRACCEVDEGRAGGGLAMTGERTVETVQMLLEQAHSILTLRERRAETPGARFNIFSVLGMETDEVNTHCRLLYELLRPDGCHGLGDQLLRVFFELVLHKPYAAGTVVARERVIDAHAGQDHGRIDLVVEGKGFCYPIEVKIFARDQWRQMRRYAQYAARAQDCQVYYLTLDGHMPSEDSMGGAELPELVCLSFNGDIRRWLLRCGELAWQAPAVAEIIRQYISLLDRLTGRGQGDEYMEMIQRTIAMSQANYEGAAAIERVMAPLRSEMMARVFSEIEAHIGGRLRKLRATYQEDAVRFYGPERRRVWPSLTYFIAQCGEYTIALHIEVEWKLYHGLIFFRGDFQQAPQEIGKIKDAFPGTAWRELVTSLEPRDWWLWYKYLTEESPINFRDCDGRYPELFDPKRHQAIMEEIFAQMDHDIELAQKTGAFE